MPSRLDESNYPRPLKSIPTCLKEHKNVKCRILGQFRASRLPGFEAQSSSRPQCCACNPCSVSHVVISPKIPAPSGFSTFLWICFPMLLKGSSDPQTQHALQFGFPGGAAGAAPFPRPLSVCLSSVARAILQATTTTTTSTMANVLNNLFGGKSSASPDPTQGAADPGTHALSLALCPKRLARCLAVSSHARAVAIDHLPSRMLPRD